MGIFELCLKLHFIGFCMFFCGKFCQAKQGYNDRFMAAKQQLSNTFYQSSRDSNNIKMEMDLLWSYPFDSQNPSVHEVVQTPNRMLVVSGAQVWCLEDEVFKEVATLPEFMSFEIQFVKGIEWEGKLFLLFCFNNNQCRLYIAMFDFDFKLCQPLSDAGIPTDAQFFDQSNNLFLAIIFQAPNSTISQTRIYRWTGTNFDLDSTPDDPKMTSTASTITVFKHKENVILILGCSSRDNIKFPTQVWQRGLGGEMTKLQYLPTAKPFSFTHFIERGEHFLLVQDVDLESSIYWWEGSEFVKWIHVDRLTKLNNISVSSNIKYTSLLVFTQGNSLSIYVMTATELERVFDTRLLSDDSRIINTILSATLFEENGKTYLLIHSKSEGGMYMTLFKAAVYLYPSDSEGSDVRELPSYLTEEELKNSLNRVKDLDNQMHTLESIIPSLLLTNTATTVNSTLNIATVEVQGGEIWNLTLNNIDIASMIQNNQLKISALHVMVHNFTRDLQNVEPIPRRHLTFNGNVHLRQGTMNLLSAASVNGKTFKPDSFLSIKKGIQRLQNVKAKNLKVDWLVLEQIENISIEDVLLKDSIVRVPVRVSQVEANNVHINNSAKINNIKAKDIAEKAVTFEIIEENYIEPIVTEGDRRFGTVNTLQLQNNTVITNLYVDEINNVKINDLLMSLFVQENNTVINGSLHFKKGLGAKTLVSDKVFNIKIPDDVEHIEPFSTNMQYYQLYNSNIQNLQTYDPSIDYSLQTYDPNIPNPQLYNYNIQYPLQNNSVENFLPYQNKQFLPRGFYNRQEQRRRRRDNKDSFTTLVYRVKVKILGNLKVKRLVFVNSSLIVNGSPLPTADLDHHFWTCNSHQFIHEPVHFQKGITLHRGLADPIINDMSITQYATIKSHFKSIVLENIYIGGNLHVNRISGVKSNYHNKKLQCKVVEVKHLKTHNLNGKPLDNVLRADHIYSRDFKIFVGNLSVKQDMFVGTINGINLQTQLGMAVRIDRDATLEKVNFNNISASSMDVNFINNYTVEELMNLEKWRWNTIVHLRGDLHLRQPLNTTLINNKPTNFDLVVHRDKNTVIHGKKYFPGQVVVENKINITNINHRNLEQLMEELLRRSTDQTVSGLYTVRTAKIKTLSAVDEINRIKTSRFVYINQDHINITSHIAFGSLHIEGNLSATNLLNNCVLPKHEVGEPLEFTDPSKWRVLEVTDDCEWPTRPGGQLQQLMDSAVTEADNQTITGQVVFDQLYVESITAYSLNNINLSFLFEDTVLKNEPNQVISGKKHFTGTFNCDYINVEGDARIKSINDIAINDVDKKLVRNIADHSTNNTPISGHKTFVSGFKASQFSCKDGINGIPANVLATENFEGILPPLITTSLQVHGPLQVDTINDVDIDKLIMDCVYLKYTNSYPISHHQIISGNIFISGNVTIEGPVSAPHINNISPSDLVYTKTGSKSVLIKGCKTFSDNIFIDTKLDVGALNNRNLSRTYEKSVKSFQNVTFNGSVVLLSEAELNTIYAQQYYVGTTEMLYINSTIVP